MSGVDIQKIIAHFGTKGMRWGVRNDRNLAGRLGATNATKADNKWMLKTGGQYDKVLNAAIERSNSEIPRINNDPKFKGKDFTKPSKLRDQYYEAHRSAFERALNEEASSRIPNSPSGQFKATFKVAELGQRPYIAFEPTNVQHAADTTLPTRAWVNTNANGEIINFELETPQMKHQTMVDVEAIIAHYGVKGQKWGVRKMRSNGGVTKFKEKPKHLTDQELADRIKRLETEKKYKELNKRQVSTGRKHINEVLVHIGKETVKKFGVGAATTTAKIVLNRKFANSDKTDLKALGDQIFPKKK